jgi:hypothetical protein
VTIEVVSAVTDVPSAELSLTAPVRATVGADTEAVEGEPTIIPVEDGVELARAAESRALAGCWLDGIGFGGGNRTCETAITINYRKRARKKRLSIQGTGS